MKNKKTFVAWLIVALLLCVGICIFGANLDPAKTATKIEKSQSNVELLNLDTETFIGAKFECVEGKQRS